MTNSFTRGMRVGCAVLLLFSGCAGTDSSQVASGPGTPIATTPPLAVPPVLQQSGGVVIATTAPAQPVATTEVVREAATSVPTSEPDLQPPATLEPQPTTPPATSVPATAVPAADTAAATPATAIPATAVPATDTAAAAAATPGPAVPATAVPVAAAPVATGAAISLGADFEVVNLVTRTNQNIAELSPSGPTVLWFWAPH